MKNIIRKGIFETNSSSMHSLIIKKDYTISEDLSKMGKILTINPSNCDIYRGENKIITGVIEKAEALISMVISSSRVLNEDIYCNSKDPKILNKKLNIEIKPFIDAVKNAFINLKIFDEIKINIPTLYPYYPIYSPKNFKIGIDGAWFSDSYEFEDFLKTILINPSLLHMFLFNKDSLIISAWDEDDEGYKITDQVKDKVIKEGLEKYALFACAKFWKKE